jgi:hypothetical protein
MPHNDYDDPELSIPRLEIRVVKTDDDAFHVQVWKSIRAGQREAKPLWNGKRAGSSADVGEFIKRLAAKEAIDISPDDVERPDAENRP